ncbi:LysR substrate-binding domain-containing protein [Pseudomonas sp.]|uniref:LysR substrate-binding domain-containing protein n=1 Tax=Pseudomonas sp. TaxID=306 RepID=UPI0039C9FBD0
MIAALEEAEAGMGIALLPDFIVEEALAAGRLGRCCAHGKPAITINAVHSSARRVPQKTRTFIEFLAEQLAPQV